MGEQRQRDEIQKSSAGLSPPAATASATGQLVVGTPELGARDGPPASQPASHWTTAAFASGRSSQSVTGWTPEKKHAHTLLDLSIFRSLDRFLPLSLSPQVSVDRSLSAVSRQLGRGRAAYSSHYSAIYTACSQSSVHSSARQQVSLVQQV